MNSPIEKYEEIKTSMMWTKLFLDRSSAILAPRGTKKHFTGKEVAVLDFLTTERIEKVAHEGKRILVNYITELSGILGEFEKGFTVQLKFCTELITEIESKWYWRLSKKLRREMRNQQEIKIRCHQQMQALQNFKSLIQIVKPTYDHESQSKSS